MLVLIAGARPFVREQANEFSERTGFGNAVHLLAIKSGKMAGILEEQAHRLESVALQQLQFCRFFLQKDAQEKIIKKFQ